jgi:amino acid transporter
MTSANPYSNKTTPYPPPGSPPPRPPLYVPYDPDQRVLRLIAVVVLSFFCLIHYFSVSAGRALNKVFAFVKICLLLVVIFAGIYWCCTGGRLESWTASNGDLQIAYNSSDSTDSAAAFLLIIFSFTGWENATFVSPLFVVVMLNTNVLAGIWRGCKSSSYAQGFCSRRMHCGRTLHAC